MSALVIIGSIFLFIAAAIHVLIFFLESILWQKPSTWKRFGLRTQEEADTVKPMAFNQGFYNLFLAIGVGVGLVMLGAGNFAGGTAIALFAGLSMVLAAVVLITSSPKLARSAALQGVAPLIGVLFLAIALLT
jgi:putative membrane protein